MKRLMLWFCAHGWHRGDMVWMPGTGTTIDCKTCGRVIHQ